MSNSADKATGGPVNNALSAAGYAVGSVTGSVPSVATRVIESTGTDVTSMADNITTVGLQPFNL